MTRSDVELLAAIVAIILAWLCFFGLVTGLEWCGGGRPVRPRRAICDSCYGTGEYHGRTCPDCEGAGIVDLPVEAGGYELPDEPPPGWCEVER